MSVSVTGAISAITSAVSQLRLGGVTAQREATIEQQLVKQISGANPSANWGMIATLTNDLSDPTLTTGAINVDVAALERMVAPTVGTSGLTAAINTLAQQIRGQNPTPPGATTLSADALANAASVTVPSTTGMQSGDTVRVQLDTGKFFNTKITTILGNTVNLAGRIPSQASLGRGFIDTALEIRDAAATGQPTNGSIVTGMTGFALFGTSTVTVSSATGMNTGDSVQVGLSDGSTFNTTIAGITGSTTLTADALAHTMNVVVGNVAGMNNGDAIKIALDDGTTFNTIIGSIAGNTITLAAPLPSKATTGATFTDTANIKITLASPLPVSAASGDAFTDTQNIPASSQPISVPTFLTAAAASRATSLTVNSAGAMAVGDALQIQLDNGSVFNTTISGILGNVISIAGALPSAASINNTATSLVNPTQGTTRFTPAVAVSSDALSILQLQLDTLIGLANASVNTSKLSGLETTLITSTLTTAQFQQDLTTLIQLAVKGLPSGTSVLA